MSYTADDTSIALGEPIELYEFEGPNLAFRYTSYHRDINFGGNLYQAIPIARSALEGAGSDDDVAVEVTLPVDAALVRTYGNQPPTRLFLTLRRYHPTGGPSTAIVQWRGDVTAITVTDRLARVRVPNLVGAALNTPMPTVYYQNQCNHVLFGSRCRAVRSQFQVPDTTVTSIADGGRTVTVASVDGIPALAANLPPITPVDYLNAGEFVRVADGERRMIVDNQFTILTLNRPFSTLLVGDTVQLFAGCDHTLDICASKFGNTVNFGGYPTIPRRNIFGSIRGPF